MLRAFSGSDGSTNLRPSELVASGLVENRQSYVCRVALSREPLKLQQAQPLLAAWNRYRALLPLCERRCWRAGLGMRHADLLREATAVIATPVSAPCMILQCGTWYGCVAMWPFGCVFGGGKNDAIVSKNTCKTFWAEFSTGGSSRKSRVFRLDPPVGIISRKKLSRNNPFSTA